MIAIRSFHVICTISKPNFHFLPFCSSILAETHYGYYNNIPVSTAIPIPATPFSNPPVAYPVPPTPSPASFVVPAAELPATFDLGRKPAQIICPCCKRNVATRTKTSPNWMTWSAVAGVAVLFWPVFFVPLLIDPVSECGTACH